jgi:hypothetical protein
MLEKQLNNKKIIFFSVQTFNLEKEIILKLEELGAQVEYYDERPSNNNFAKGIIRLKRDFYQYKIDKYYIDILEKSKKNKYDYLFVNRGEVIPSFFLEKFKLFHPNCMFIFYTWDSFKNHNHPTTILKYFDRKFTFDPEDAHKYNINFRPLFYLDSFKNCTSDKSINSIYDLLFLGTAHSDRYRISKRIIDWCNINGLNSFSYYYMQGRIVYLYKILFDKTFKEFDYKKLNFRSLKSTDITELYKKSNVILDINHPGQKGLTMRTFETIGSNKKMITTNAEIKRYSFYNPNNIFIIDRDGNIPISKDFFRNDYEPISIDLFNRLSIEGWLDCLFFCNESDTWIKGLK